MVANVLFIVSVFCNVLIGECNELVRSENTIQPNFILDSTQIQDDINTINRSIINTSVSKSSTV